MKRYWPAEHELVAALAGHGLPESLGRPHLSSPFLREVYYLPCRSAGVSNTQLGVLMSVFGATALVTYFPGGWLADRFSPAG